MCKIFMVGEEERYGLQVAETPDNCTVLLPVSHTLSGPLPKKEMGEENRIWERREMKLKWGHHLLQEEMKEFANENGKYATKMIILNIYHREKIFIIS